jgi:hypothetical protein
MPLTAVNGNAAAGQERHHKRSRSAVLRSLVAPGSRKTDAANRSRSKSPTKRDMPGQVHVDATKVPSALPSGHPDVKHPLGEVNNLQGSSPRKHSPTEQEAANKLKSLHKKNKSAVSLKSLTGRDKEKDKAQEKEDPRKSTDRGRPKKTKSSTNLSAFLSRPKSFIGSRTESEASQQDKENETPPSSASLSAPPPIWAQFAKPITEEIKNTYKIRLNDTNDDQDETELYAPREYSPSKTRNFHGAEPVLEQKQERRGSPKSAMVDSVAAKTSSDTFTKLRKTSASKSGPLERVQDKSKNAEATRGRTMAADTQRREENIAPGNQGQKTTSRVMAAVAAFNGKSKDKDVAPATPREAKPDPFAIDSAFEAMLVSLAVSLLEIEHNNHK